MKNDHELLALVVTALVVVSEANSQWRGGVCHVRDAIPVVPDKGQESHGNSTCTL